MSHPGIESRFVEIDGVSTHYLEGGAGATVVLLHSGEFGGAAELSWEFTLGPLAERFHVVAPDWLGFGRTDKLVDFADRRGRVIRHMRRFLETTGIALADFIGNSMGGSMLAQIAADRPVIFPIRSLVLASGGGQAIDSAARRALLAYDGTADAMRALLAAMMADPKWAEDAAYVARRQVMATMPGAWEAAASARLRPPAGAARNQFGQADTTPYESIAVPTLIVAGADDALRAPGYAGALAGRIPNAELRVFDNCGHCPNIEHAQAFNRAVIDFLERVHAAG